MNPQNVTDTIEKIAGIFASKGLVREDSMNGVVCLVDPSTRKKTYLGTYLNPFCLIGHEDGEPYLWTDELAKEDAWVSISPVYRHNGTAQNVSIQICVTFAHSSVYKAPIHANDLRNPLFVEMVKKESPTDYIARGYKLSASMCGEGTRIAKFRHDASDRVIGNAVNKAMEFIKTFVPRDNSQWEQSREDYHSDTSSEYRAYKASYKANNP